MSMTAAAFDAAVLRRCLWPDSNAPLTQVERLAVADEEISGTLFPLLIDKHADYYLSTEDHDITATYSRYRLPRNHFGPIKDIKYLTAEDVASGKDGRNIDLIDIGELGRRTDCGLVAFVDGDFIGLDPVPEETLGVLRMRYYRQPNALTLDGWLVSGLDLEGLPTALPIAPETGTPTNPVSGDFLDVISAGNAHQLLCDGLEVDGFGLGVASVTTSLVGTGIQVGDWVAVHGFVPIVPLPNFMLTAAVRWVAAACLNAVGDPRAQVDTGKAQSQIDLALRLAKPRVQDEPPVTRTRYSPFRRWAF